jgi:hypothetical protein
MSDLPAYFEISRHTLALAIYDFNLNVSKPEPSPVWTKI